MIKFGSFHGLELRARGTGSKPDLKCKTRIAPQAGIIIGSTVTAMIGARRERDVMIRLPRESPDVRSVFYFGPFTLDVARRQLFCRGVALRVTSKALHLLYLLVRNAGVTLTIGEIMSIVWGDSQSFTDATLRQHILMLRHALDEHLTGRYIATDYGRGYRFVGEVSERPLPFTVSLVEQYCAAGAEFRNSASPAALAASLNLYERALAIDASSAAALAGAALTRVLMADFQYDRPSGLLELARSQSEAALLVEPNRVDALMALCKVQLDYSWDFAGASDIARRAIGLDPKHRIAAFMYAWILALSSHSEESIAFIDSLPANISNVDIMQTCRGIATLFLGDYAAAKAELAVTCERWPDYWFARTFLGLALVLLGEEDLGLAHFDEVRLSTYHPLVQRQMNARYFSEGYALYTRFRIGDTEGAEEGLQRLMRLAESQFVPAMCFALAEIGRKNRDAALQYVDLCGRNRECWYTHLGVDPLVKELDLDAERLYGQAIRSE
jgi:DNA-binding winged helix-turn-helix (wHTH) protein